MRPAIASPNDIVTKEYNYRGEIEKVDSFSGVPFYDVEIYELPKINEKSVQKPQPIYFSDLPDKEIIRKALSIARYSS